jgi:hypothetical protein
MKTVKNRLTKLCVHCWGRPHAGDIVLCNECDVEYNREFLESKNGSTTLQVLNHLDRIAGPVHESVYKYNVDHVDARRGDYEGSL